MKMKSTRSHSSVVVFFSFKRGDLYTAWDRKINLKNNTNNNYDNVYGAIVMTKVIARVHPVRLMNVGLQAY